MLKKTITYVDFDGNKRTEDFFFNITKAELMEMELSEVGGLEKMIRKIIAEQDQTKIITIFKDMIKKSYGVKSPDGRKFIKNQEVLDDFMQTEAFSDLFMELATDEEEAAKFIKGIMPADIAEEVEKQGNVVGIPEKKNNPIPAPPLDNKHN